jgi:hypothetical protein
MTLRNAFGDLALETTAQDTKDAVDNVRDAIEDTTTAVGGVNAAIEDTTDAVELLAQQVILLRRLNKLMESQATIDSNQRQRVTIDSIASVTLPTVTTVGTVNTVGTTNTVTNTNQFAGVDLRWQWMENARVAYNTGIRSKLS